MDSSRVPSLVQCLGGWCRKRTSCAHYHAPIVEGVEPEDRLCAAGLEEPVQLQLQKIGPSDPRWWQSTREASE